MLCKLSLKNIKKSIKDYAIYFFTLILGVAIFYVFNAIDSQTVMMDVTSSTREIITLMTNMLSGVSVFVSFILGFLIIYASRFLIKRRNKEFGIYLTLGMSKRKIASILFLETLFIGMISLAVGLSLGIILSQLMSLLVANMFEANLTKFAFTFSSSACIKTLIYFSIMYVLVMIFNTFNVGRCKLIDLLHGNKKSEKVRLKNPILCTFIFLVSSIVLGYAYYLVTGGISELTDASEIFKPIIMGAVSTFFLFWSLSGLLLRIIMKLKKIYYHGLNTFVLRQISSKINTTVMSMTIICLMLFVTICVLSSSLSIKNSMTANLKTMAPADIQLYKYQNITEEQVKKTWNLTENMIEDGKLPLKDTLTHLNFNAEEYLQDIVEISLYSDTYITLKNTLGTYYNELKNIYPIMNYDAQEIFIKLSDYNKLAEILEEEKYTLKENEYIVLADYKELVDIRNEALKRDTKIQIANKEYIPKYDEVKNGFIFMNSTHANSGVFIVPDDAFANALVKETILTANYKGKEEEKYKIENKIMELESHPYNKQTSLSAITKISLYEASIGLGAMATFIGLYLGIIFLISSAALLALKELSEQADNKMRFTMLRKIGTDEKLLNKALFYQIGIFFLFPLLIAGIHSIFGIKFCNFILASFGSDKLLPSIIMTALFLIIIYGGYFLLTYFVSKNMIREK